MSEWKAKRFWTKANAAEVPGGWEVRLDERRLRTPSKAPLVLPTRALAEAIAAEWDAQEDIIDPRAMPFTRTANSAIDKVAPQRSEVVSLLAAYGDSDLLCYRADGPVSLVQRQAEAWDRHLSWASETFGATLVVTTGIVPIAQPRESLERLGAEVDALGVFHLAAFHDLVALSGSLVLGLATLHGAAPAEELWTASRVDETWQEEQWGVDEEASRMAEQKRGDFIQAQAFIALLNDEA